MRPAGVEWDFNMDGVQGLKEVSPGVLLLAFSTASMDIDCFGLAPVRKDIVDRRRGSIN